MCHATGTARCRRCRAPPFITLRGRVPPTLSKAGGSRPLVHCTTWGTSRCWTVSPLPCSARHRNYFLHSSGACASSACPAAGPVAMPRPPVSPLPHLWKGPATASMVDRGIAVPLLAWRRPLRQCGFLLVLPGSFAARRVGCGSRIRMAVMDFDCMSVCMVFAKPQATLDT